MQDNSEASEGCNIKKIMAVGYRFDDFKPSKGSTIHAFKSLSALKDFAKMQGSKGSIKFWKIEGSIIRDEGGPDGLVMKVDSVEPIS